MFRQEPLIDYALEENRLALQRALQDFEARRLADKLHACPIIGGRQCLTQESIASLDPSSADTLIGKVHLAGGDQALAALTSLRDGLPEWRRTPFEQRAAIIKVLGRKMRDARLELTALVIREAGKPWKDADAEVVEAIDFCEYYADEMLRLGHPRKIGSALGEQNWYFYQPRGIALILPPWNFPLAITCGMTVAALVAGNAALLKPSGLTSIIAYEFAKLVLAAGVPAGAFAFLPGRGALIGDLLVKHPLVNMICFTGSKEVGLRIMELAACTSPEQPTLKRVIAEMGGKNAVIVDEDADLDEAIRGVLYSAFGYAGQKCSACSRVIAVGTAYETFMARLCDAAADLIVGPSEDSSSYLGPVIDAQARQRIENFVLTAQQTCKLAYRGTPVAGGCFVAPVIFRDVASDTALWRDEIFGPVLACCSAKNFEEALRLANDSEYALTGGVFSRSPENIARARSEFMVGNLYINRGTTGAMVNRQPFGGFKLSGIGSKAGGPDYLLQFLEPRTVTENTTRRGFTPELAA